MVSIRSLLVLTGKKRAHEFASGQPHGSEFYWRLNRAHVNSVENLAIFTAIVVCALATGVQSERLGELAWVVLVARITQSLFHLAANSHVVVTARFLAFTVQLVCFGWMAAIVVFQSPTLAEQKASQPAATRPISACTVSIRSKASQQAFKGKATHADKQQALDAAWKKACAALPDGSVAFCRDESRFKGQTVMATDLGGPDRGASYEATVTVRAVAPVFEGTGQSQAGGAQACQQAVTQACEAGGARADCVTQKTFELLTKTERVTR